MRFEHGRHLQRHKLLHFPHGSFKTDQHGLRHDRMADVEFVHSLNFGDASHIAIRQSVAHVQLQSLSRRELPGFAQFIKFNVRIFRRLCISLSTGVNFDGRHAENFCGFDVGEIRVNKQTDSNPGTL